MKTSFADFRASLFGTLLLAVAATTASAGETVLYNFAGSPDGAAPQSDLIADKAGNLYGTTLYGGAQGSGSGTVFELSPNGSSWTERVIYKFLSGTDGNGPVGGLVIDRKGNLYGATQSGGTGSSASGTVFELKPPLSQGKRWRKNTLYSFCSQTNCTDGATPYAGVTLGPKGVLYGTTSLGGNGAFQANGGTVYELVPPVDKGGAWTETVLHNFCDQVNCADGWQPSAERLLLLNEILYGTAPKSDNAGTLYQLAPRGNTWSFAVLHDFSLSGGDGRGPLGGVVADKNGVLYGTTAGDSVNGCGTVYSLGGSYQQLYVFCSKANNADGAYPHAGVTLALGKNGAPVAIYGTTQSGGPFNGGVVFKLTSGGETVLHGFCAETNCADGAGPLYGSLLSFKGSYYGTTPAGGSSNLGVVYSVTR